MGLVVGGLVGGRVVFGCSGRLRLFWAKDRLPTAVAHGYIYLKKPFGLIPDYRPNTKIRSTLLSLAISLLVFFYSVAKV